MKQGPPTAVTFVFVLDAFFCSHGCYFCFYCFLYGYSHFHGVIFFFGLVTILSFSLFILINIDNDRFDNRQIIHNPSVTVQMFLSRASWWVISILLDHFAAIFVSISSTPIFRSLCLEIWYPSPFHESGSKIYTVFIFRHVFAQQISYTKQKNDAEQ